MLPVSFQALDTVLVIILLGFLAWGFANGFIRAVGGIIGIIISSAIASHSYLVLADQVQPWFGSYAALAPILSFLLLFTLIGYLFGLLVWLVDKAFHLIAFIPFLKSINRLLGALFGLGLGVVFIGVLLLVVSKYSDWPAINNALSSSVVAHIIIEAIRPLNGILSSELSQLHIPFNL